LGRQVRTKREREREGGRRESTHIDFKNFKNKNNTISAIYQGFTPFFLKINK